ncbi:signal peptidase I [[Kitasatospora] papulosa]|uniref:signal peptidase I n=1 Tax=[Kitasatospora] papulosa TaxID=1464011 RepID=UPI002E11A240|nr:signal peptidase I [[Kitasatospora] papulosa]
MRSERRDMRPAGRGLRVTAWVTGTIGAALIVAPLALFGSGWTTARVSGGSMEPTYSVGERVTFERIEARDVRRGDVVLYRVPDRYEGLAVLGRVIGTGGDHVVQRSGAPVTVNGSPLTEPYVKDGDPSGMALEYDVMVPEGRIFVLGDFRANARDSRSFLDDRSGTVAATAVLGRTLHDRTGLVGLGLSMLFGLALAVTAVVTSIVARRRGRPKAVWPPSPV